MDNPFEFLLQELARQNKTKGYAGAPDPLRDPLIRFMAMLALPAKVLTAMNQKGTSQKPPFEGAPMPFTGVPQNSTGALAQLGIEGARTFFDNPLGVLNLPFPGRGTTANIPPPDTGPLPR